MQRGYAHHALRKVDHLMETATGQNLRTEVSSIMAVCGNAVVKALMSQSMSISFGCPDSRRYSGIQPEEIVIAVPTGLLHRITGPEIDV
jgi:uncharacterized protein (DUF169 family)